MDVPETRHLPKGSRRGLGGLVGVGFLRELAVDVRDRYSLPPCVDPLHESRSLMFDIIANDVGVKCIRDPTCRSLEKVDGAI